ncbi:Beta-3 adrenergic receptor [Intoshia linei]|uniref:Beta-3 adrenergic receptor n=1 Tax=Intoshia linei TaxID=1819745 RepID=A0A177BCF1_9BILA|nr:Beta-3 adrenergic receptor [Intoshia linei]
MNETAKNLTYLILKNVSQINTNQLDDNDQLAVRFGPFQYFVIIAITILVIFTILGNSLVIFSVLLVAKLRTPSNLLILNLAISDMLVATVAMPLASVHEIYGYWPLSQTVCEIFTSMDVMLCTASILNLCMISIDRYYFITRPFVYSAKRTVPKFIIMIVGVWITSTIITLPPLFGWKSEPVPNDCIMSQNIGYQFYATIGSFYLPCAVMCVIYYKIYAVSRRLNKSEARAIPSISVQQSLVTQKSDRKSTINSEASNKLDVIDKVRKKVSIKKFNFKRNVSSQKSNLSAPNNESKAIKTLGIVMGTFIICWMPFFILALIRPFKGEIVPKFVSSLLLWIGYSNSLFNPIIYVSFNREFREPFKHILLCHCMGLNERIKHQGYAQKFGQQNYPLRRINRQYSSFKKK